LATWKTGRSRTITITGSMVGNYADCVDIVPVGAPSQSHNISSSGSMTVAWGSVGCVVTWQQAPGGPPAYNLGVLVTANDGQGHSGSNIANTGTVTNGPPGPKIDWESLGVSGSYTFSVFVEEWAETYTPSSSSPVDGTSFPTYGGAAEGDGLPASGIQFYEVAPVGAVLHVAISYGGAAVSLSNALTSPMAIGYVQIGALAQGVFGASYVYSVTTSLTFDTSVSLPTQTWTDTDSSGTSTASYFGRTMSLTSANVPGAPAGAHGSSSGATQPLTAFTLNGRLNCFGAPFPGAGHSLVIQEKLTGTASIVLNPTGSTSWTQNFYNLAATLQGVNFGPIALDERTPVACWLSGLSPDDSRDWRCMFSGFKWSALSLSHASSLTIDACSATTNWTAGAHTTISIVGGQLQAVAGGGVGSISLAAPHAVRVWEAFRYLQISGSFDPGGSTPTSLTLSVGIAGKSWNLVLTQSTTSPLLDLCCATNDTETVDSTQSRFPIASPGGFPINTDPVSGYKLGWGVNFCDTLVIGGIPDGYSVTLGGISLVESSDPQKQTAITLLEPFLSFNTGWTDPTDTTSVQDYLLVETDYRVLDLPALALVTPFSGSPGFVWYTIAQLQTMLAYFPGLTAVLLTSPTDGYHGSGQPGLLLGGEGSTYDWTASTWADWVDVSLPQTSIPAQDLWDEITVYPQAGNVWPQSAPYGGSTPLQVSKNLRSQAWGIVFTPAGLPVVGAQVALYETAHPGTSEGTGITNGLGYYQTGTPWAYGNVDTTTDLNIAPIPHLTSHATLQNRQRARTSFRHVPVAVKELGYDVSNGLRHVRSYLNTGTGHLGLRFAGNVLPQTWTDIDTGITVTWARPRFADVGSNWPTGVFYGDGANCAWARSYDEGQTWVDLLPMGTGMVGDYEEGANGLRWFFKVDTPDSGTTYNVYNRVLDAQLNVLRDWTITTVTGIDNAPIACRESPAADGSWRIGLFYSIGGADTVKFSNDGLHFT